MIIGPGSSNQQCEACGDRCEPTLCELWQGANPTHGPIHSTRSQHFRWPKGGAGRAFVDYSPNSQIHHSTDKEQPRKNVKHLLLDDALTWYSNAYLSGALQSWSKRWSDENLLPAIYAYILRAETYHRLQGVDESFSKFFQALSTLFQHVDQPMGEQEKLFIIMKNMNATYAPIAASHQIANM